MNFKVVEKPPGISVHNSEKGEVHFLDLLKKELSAKTIYAVHRLDKETSGLMLIAFDEKTCRDLQDLFQKRLIRKTYLAVLRGVLTPPKGSWTWAISDQGEGRRNPQVLANQRNPAQTNYEQIKVSKYLTLVECQLMTGYQHQIRKHAALAKHPIVGDPRYNDLKYNESIVQRYQLARMFLHSCELKFSLYGQDYHFTSPAPKEFLNFFDTENSLQS